MDKNENKDYIIDLMRELSNSGLDEIAKEFRKAHKKKINEYRKELIDFLQADRHRIIMEHQQAQIGHPEYVNSAEYKDSVEIALKLSQLIRLMIEEEQ